MHHQEVVGRENRIPCGRKRRHRKGRHNPSGQKGKRGPAPAHPQHRCAPCCKDGNRPGKGGGQRCAHPGQRRAHRRRLAGSRRGSETGSAGTAREPALRSAKTHCRGKASTQRAAAPCRHETWGRSGRAKTEKQRPRRCNPNAAGRRGQDVRDRTSATPRRAQQHRLLPCQDGSPEQHSGGHSTPPGHLVADQDGRQDRQRQRPGVPINAWARSVGTASIRGPARRWSSPRLQSKTREHSAEQPVGQQAPQQGGESRVQEQRGQPHQGRKPRRPEPGLGSFTQLRGHRSRDPAATRKGELDGVWRQNRVGSQSQNRHQHCRNEPEPPPDAVGHGAVGAGGMMKGRPRASCPALSFSMTTRDAGVSVPSDSTAASTSAGVGIQGVVSTPAALAAASSASMRSVRNCRAEVSGSRPGSCRGSSPSSGTGSPSGVPDPGRPSRRDRGHQRRRQQSRQRSRRARVRRSEGGRQERESSTPLRHASPAVAAIPGALGWQEQGFGVGLGHDSSSRLPAA